MEVANWITAISTLVMALATIAMAVFARNALNTWKMQQKREEFQKKDMELQKEIADKNSKLQERASELQEKLINEINNILKSEKYKEYAIILNSMAVMQNNGATDITQNVIKDLNKKK